MFDMVVSFTAWVLFVERVARQGRLAHKKAVPFIPRIFVHEHVEKEDQGEPVNQLDISNPPDSMWTPSCHTITRK